jgi:hypothetical protein
MYKQRITKQKTAAQQQQEKLRQALAAPLRELL